MKKLILAGVVLMMTGITSVNAQNARPANSNTTTKPRAATVPTADKKSPSGTTATSHTTPVRSANIHNRNNEARATPAPVPTTTADQAPVERVRPNTVR